MIHKTKPALKRFVGPKLIWPAMSVILFSAFGKCGGGEKNGLFQKNRNVQHGLAATYEQQQQNETHTGVQQGVALTSSNIANSASKLVVPEPVVVSQQQRQSGSGEKPPIPPKPPTGKKPPIPPKPPTGKKPLIPRIPMPAAGEKPLIPRIPMPAAGGQRASVAVSFSQPNDLMESIRNRKSPNSVTKMDPPEGKKTPVFNPKSTGHVEMSPHYYSVFGSDLIQ